MEAVPVSRREVMSALRVLTEEGFAQTYSYDVETKHYQAVSFRADLAGVLWFYITDKGMRAVNRLHKQAPEIS